MKLRPMIAIYASVSLLLVSALSLYVPEADVQAAGVKLSKKNLAVRAGKSKVLKVTGTYRTVAWSIKSGKAYVKLKNIKRQQVTVVGKKKGKAVVRAQIWYSAKSKKTYTCKVTVKDKQWQCPSCGYLNTTNYCSNCGYAKPTPTPTPIPWQPTPTPTATPVDTPSASPTVTPTPTATPYGWTPTPSPTPTPYGWTPTPSPTPTPAGWTPTPSPTATGATPTPVSPDELADRNIVMIVNRSNYFNVQLYANPAATTFYDLISKGKITGEYAMGPGGEYERCCSLQQSITPYTSDRYRVEAGELFLYGSDILKISASTHNTGGLPTRIGKVIAEHVYMLPDALSRTVDGKTTVQFKLYV